MKDFRFSEIIEMFKVCGINSVTFSFCKDRKDASEVKPEHVSVTEEIGEPDPLRDVEFDDEDNIQPTKTEVKKTVVRSEEQPEPAKENRKKEEQKKVDKIEKVSVKTDNVSTKTAVKTHTTVKQHTVPESAEDDGPSGYEGFMKILENDDGNVNAMRNRIEKCIKTLNMDDIIRINNENALGIDTDQPIDGLRNDLFTIFNFTE